MPILEDHVEQEALGWFAELGYDLAFGPAIAPDGESAERSSYKDVVLVDRLRSALSRINPHLPYSAIDDALRQIISPNLPGMVQTNRQFHRWLTTGIPIQYQKDGDTRGDRVKLADFTNADNNDWLAVNQYSVEGAKHTRRPDIVVFLNGLPIAVIELKNPATENADVWAAFRQIQTYKDDIPDLFHYNELLVASDHLYARLGSLTASAERYMGWRTIDGEALDPLGPMRELETMIRGLFDRTLLLDYLRHFILFEDDDGIVKKIAGYHQFHAVRAVLGSVLAASAPGGSRKGGVVWHTQGAGKSIEMTCLAGKIMACPDMKNPTIVVITDRNDLDGQLFGVFSGVSELLGETPVQATSRPELRQLLADRPAGGIIFATIQKFVPGEDEDTFPCLTERENVVVICDEAHRSQYGFNATIKASGAITPGYAQHLRDGLPRATFVAFTGTPISSEDKDTRSVFGEYVHIYDIEQAVQDKATVPIYYESRLARLELKPDESPTMDDEVDELTEEEEESDRAKLKSRWSALERLAEAEPRIRKIAADLVEHFENRQSVMDGKAMVVCMSREICVHLYDAIVALRPQWHDQDPEKGVIKIVMTGSASDKAMLKPHIYSGPTKKRLEKRFKDAADPFKIVIVRDMWLTGFDAPCLSTMYVDKPMREHNLMQAIARVNRVFRDKPGGLVVDYIGIANELKQALKNYTNSKGKGKPTIDAAEALTVLIEKMEVARGILNGFDYAGFRTKALTLLPGAANHILGQEEGKRRFADCVVSVSKAFALCCTLDEARSFRDEIAFFQAIRSALAKKDPRKSLGDEDKEAALRQIISNALVSDEVVDIFEAAGLEKPDVGILSDEFLEDIRRMKERNLAVELLERLLKGQIKSRFATNVAMDKKFSELLQNALTRYRNRAIETAAIIEELIAMAKQFVQEAERGGKLGLNNDEIAFYDALASNESAVRELGDDQLKIIAMELTDKLRKNLSVDWSVRDSVRAKLRLMVRTVLKRYKYPPDKQDEATEVVLQQAEALTEVWLQA